MCQLDVNIMEISPVLQLPIPSNGSTLPLFLLAITHVRKTGISGRSSHSLILFLWAVHQSPFPTCPQLTTIIPLHLSAYCQVDHTLASPTTLFFTTSISLVLKLVSLPVSFYKISRTSASSSWSVFEARRKWVNLASDKLAADPTSLGFASWFARWIGQGDWGSWRAFLWGRGWEGQEWRRSLNFPCPRSQKLCHLSRNPPSIG